MPEPKVMDARQTILVVDDQEDIRLMCRVNLALEGYEVLEASDGARALTVLAERKPDLVLLDVMMPVVDGWQVLDHIKADPALASVPVVILTARVQREDELRGWSSGAADYLSKPFNPSVLTEVVARALNHENAEARRARAIDKLRIV